MPFERATRLVYHELFWKPIETTNGKLNWLRTRENAWLFKEILQEIRQRRPGCKRVYKSTICLIWRKPLWGGSWCSEAQPLWGPLRQRERKKCGPGSSSWRACSTCVFRGLDWGAHSHCGGRQTQTPWVHCGCPGREYLAVFRQGSSDDQPLEATWHKPPARDRTAACLSLPSPCIWTWWFSTGTSAL